MQIDFLPFATATGANVMSQSDYAALAAVATGFQAGTAKSAQMNKVWRQSSIMAAVLAQFIVDSTGANAVDDGTITALLANLKAGVKNLSFQHGQCRLTTSGANLKLSPLNGNRLIINGVTQSIPSAGVTLVPSGLTASTVYYIYAYMNAGVMTLEASTTGHSTDSTTGVEIKTGDATRTLVGMEYASGTTTWAGLCRSWFNDPGFFAVTPLTSNTTINGNVTGVEVSTALRTAFLAWSNEIVFAYGDGNQVSNSANLTPSSGIAFDGASPEETYGGPTQPYQNSPNIGFSVAIHKTGLSEGYHYATLLGNVPGSFSAMWVGSATKGQRTSMKVSIGAHP